MDYIPIDIMFFAEIIVLIYLLAYGTMLDDRKTLIPLLLGHLLFVPAFIARLEHWPHRVGDILFLIGILIIGFLYSFHCYKKTKKHISDWLKLLFVWLAYLSRFFILMKWEFGMEIKLFSSILLWVILGLVIYRNWKK